MFSNSAANASLAPRPLTRRLASYRIGSSSPGGLLDSLDRYLAAAMPSLGAPRPGRLHRIARQARQLAHETSFDSDEIRWRIARLGRMLLVGRPRGRDVAAALGRVGSAAQCPTDDSDLAAAAGLLMGCLVTTNAATLIGPAVALAAAAAALSQVRVHVLCPDAMQANARLEMLRPLAGRLGFSVEQVTPVMSTAQRRSAYRADVVCTTIEQIGLDFLRDRRAVPRATRPNWYALSCLRRIGRPADSLFFDGLHLAIADGAKWILADKAVQPVALHEDSAAYDEFKMAADACEIAAALVSGEDYAVEAADRIVLHPEGQVKLEKSALSFQGVWSNRDWRETAVCRMLAVRHAWSHEHDYSFESGQFVALSDDLTRALQGDREVPSLRSLLQAKHGQSPSGVPVAQLLCHRVLSSYCRLTGLGVGVPGLASEICKYYLIPATRVGETPRVDAWPAYPRTFNSANSRAAAVLKDALAAQVDGADVFVVSRDDVVAAEVSHVLSEGRDTQGSFTGLDPERLHLVCSDGRPPASPSPPKALSSGARHFILAGVEECLKLDAETMAHQEDQQRTTWAVMLTRQELKAVALEESALGAWTWFFACIIQRLTGEQARFVLNRTARQRRRQAARHRHRILNRSQAARRALAFAQDLET